MKDGWRKYSDKFLQSTPREQYLILLTGFVVVTFVFYTFFIETRLVSLNKAEKDIALLVESNTSNQATIDVYNGAIADDPNKKIKKDIAQYERKLTSIDKKLLTLTSDLIDPIQMRHALLELLDLQKGVSLVSFELVGVEEINFVAKKELEFKTIISNIAKDSTAEKKNEIKLYRHGIKIKLKGRYFQLRDYLVQLEKLSWKFFWQDFQYNLHTYPESELEIEMYSLSTQKEFIGV